MQQQLKLNILPEYKFACLYHDIKKNLDKRCPKMFLPVGYDGRHWLVFYVSQWERVMEYVFINFGEAYDFIKSNNIKMLYQLGQDNYYKKELKEYAKRRVNG